MPANKNQIRRIQTILKMMRQNRYPNFTSFVKEMKNQDPGGAFQLSRKTFSRDIADLRDEYGAPVHYDTVRKGFYLSNPEWYNEDLMIEPFEMKSALLGERVAAGILPDPLRGEISKAVSALLMKNESGMAEGVELENFQILCPENLPRIRPEIFLAAYNAWEQRSYLRLVYRSAKNHVSEKLFEPHVFAWNGGCWYLKGKLLRDDETHYDPPKIQVLALHRIEKAEILEGQFWPEPSILKGIKEDGLFDFKKIPVVELEIFEPFARLLAPGFARRIVEKNENSIRVVWKDIPEYQAIRIVLATQGHVRIHEPESLRKSIREIAETFLRNLEPEDGKV